MAIAEQRSLLSALLCRATKGQLPVDVFVNAGDGKMQVGVILRSRSALMSKVRRLTGAGALSTDNRGCQELDAV